MSLVVDIKKKLGAFHLDVSFETEGEVLALLGASGCGKSMTLKCIAGIETPDEGRIILNGRTLFDSEKHINLAPQKRRVGYLFQQYALFPNMTVYQNIAAGARGRKDADRVIKEKIETMRLTGLEHKRPHQLSGGQQQRVALARILVNEPETLLLDEPFSALDSYLRWELEMELADTLKNFSGPAVFVSHSREEVFRLCESVCVLNNGYSEGKHTVKELFANPGTRAACILSGCKNISEIHSVGDGHVTAGDWGVELSIGERPAEEYGYIGVKSRHLRPADKEGENTIRCRVTRVVEDERRFIVVLSTPGGDTAWSNLNMTVSYGQGEKIKLGDEMLIYVAPDDIMLLRK